MNKGQSSIFFLESRYWFYGYFLSTSVFLVNLKFSVLSVFSKCIYIRYFDTQV